MRKLRTTMTALLLVLGAAGVAAADDIKDLDEAFVKAAKANDVAGILALYDEDATFYPPDAMEAKGKTAIGQYVAKFLSTYTIQDFEIFDSKSETEDDWSASWGRWRMTCLPKAGGEPVKMEGRFTAVAQKKDGRWRYIADHASMPHQ